MIYVSQVLMKKYILYLLIILLLILLLIMLFKNRLSLHPISGIITIRSMDNSDGHYKSSENRSSLIGLDRELASKHYLTVEARDDLGDGNRNNVQLVINVLDVNDNAPVFRLTKYEARIRENEINFEMPLVLEATDADLNGIHKMT